MPADREPDTETVRAIVAWLRAQSDRVMGIAGQATDEARHNYYRSLEGGYRMAADAIERGEPFRHP